MKTLIALVVLMGVQAMADTQVVLQQGQCAQVDGRNYCWFYRPSAWDHPDQAPRPCDMRKDCPLTLLIPTTVNSPNLQTGGMQNQINPVNPYVGAPAQVPPMQQIQVEKKHDSNVFMFCREVSDDHYSLVRVQVDPKTGDKKETVLNEYGDDQSKCQRDETRSSDGTYGGVSSTNGPVLIDTYSSPGISPYEYTHTEYDTIKAKDLWKKIKKLF